MAPTARVRLWHTRPHRRRAARTRLRLDEPPQPGRSAQFGATTARDLVNALNDLLDASNNFLDVWIGYEAMRMRYAYDLGQLKLNENGIWEEL